MEKPSIPIRLIYVAIAIINLLGCQKQLETSIPSATSRRTSATTEALPATMAPTSTATSMATSTQVKEDATSTPTEMASPTPSGNILYDDFSYQDQQAMADNGWIIREKAGWPGVTGASWPKENINIIDDPDKSGNYLLQMLASTNGTAVGTLQSQLCQQRKFFEGTYATRIYFTDRPISGPDGDKVVETFYMISPLEAPLDPDYSEIDNEYLPNGGWSYKDHDFAVTTWEKVQIEPWIADNATYTLQGILPGWHTIVMQVWNGKVNYYLDGELVASHSGNYYPEVPMSINYTLWFVNGGLLDSSETRQYYQLVDWVYFIAEKRLTPLEVPARVNALRAAGVQFQDTVPAWNPALPSPCDM